MGFSDLKKKGGTRLDQISKKLEEYKSTGQAQKDERYWSPVVSKENVGSAVIRFLPPPAADGDDALPFVRRYSHGFKNKKTGLWYINNSLTTLGQKDPVGEYNSELWATEDPDKRKLASAQKRRLGFIYNVYIVRHKARPEDEGKVFLYEAGQQVFDKIQAKMFPDDDEISPVDVFDFWKGANFRLNVRDKDGFRNYTSSEFDAPGPLFDKDAKMEAVYDSCYSLLAEIAPDKFKSYDELKKEFDKVIGIRTDDDDDEKPAEASPRKSRAQAAKEQKEAAADEEKEAPFDTDDKTDGGEVDHDPETGEVKEDEDDMDAFFAKLKKKKK